MEIERALQRTSSANHHANAIGLWCCEAEPATDHRRCYAPGEGPEGNGCLEEEGSEW